MVFGLYWKAKKITGKGDLMMKETRFKDTEIGRIPEDWEMISLGDVGNVQMCKRIMKYQTSEKGEIPFYKIGTFGKQADSFISSKLFEDFKAKYNYPKKGDILLSAAGTIGRTVIFDGCPSYFQDSNIVWIDNNEQVLSNSMLYYIYKNLKWVTESETIPRIYNSIVSSIIFPIPLNKHEQKRIASALTSIDNLISSLDKLIEKKKNIKQGTMQQLLTGKKRLKGFTEPWVETLLGEGLVFQCGAPFQSSYFNEKHLGLRLIKNRDLKSDDQVYYYNGAYTEDYVVHNGDLLIGMDGDFLPCIWTKGDALLNQRVGRIISEDWNLRYLYYTLREPLFMKQEGTGATTVKHLSHSDIESMRVFMTTDNNEQSAIASVLISMDNEISSLEAKRAKYETIKQGMMQQLLTGKIRLTDAQYHAKEYSAPINNDYSFAAEP